MKTDKHACALVAGLTVICSLLIMLVACISFMDNKEVVLSGISESMRRGVEQKYGYIIPDNAPFIEGRITAGKDDSLLLCYSLELDGLDGYTEGMELSEIYLLLWDGKKSDVEYNTNCSFEGIEEFESKYSIKFSYFSVCDRVHHSGMALSEPKDGMIFVYIDGYRPESSWYD